MNEPGITRNVIQIISRYSKWPSHGIKTELESQQIYADRKSWATFIDLALLSLAVAFMLAGIIFFFAYNWHLLHKFFKLGLVQVLTVSAVSAAIIFKRKPLLSNMLLLAASIFIGAMFSVFGQIYQTGADAYDFFLGWTIFMAVWALVSNFPILWLLLLTLANTTFVLFVSQTGPELTTGDVCLCLFVVDTLVLILLKSLASKNLIVFPEWFEKTLGLSIAIFITYGMEDYISGKPSNLWVVHALLGAIVYSFAIFWSFKKRSLFYLCIIPFSLLIITCALILNSSIDEITGAFFILAILVISTITLTTRWLVKLNKTWNGKS
jgi:uncharacterized membrane protein